MDETDQFFRNTNYTILRILLSASGLWPFHTLRRRCTIYLIMILVLGSGFVFQVSSEESIYRICFLLAFVIQKGVEIEYHSSGNCVIIIPYARTYEFGDLNEFSE